MEVSRLLKGPIFPCKTAWVLSVNLWIVWVRPLKLSGLPPLDRLWIAPDRPASPLDRFGSPGVAFGSPRPCLWIASWRLLASPGACWRLLAPRTPAGASWRLLAPPGASWRLLAPPGASWRLLAPPCPGPRLRETTLSYKSEALVHALHHLGKATEPLKTVQAKKARVSSA